MHIHEEVKAKVEKIIKKLITKNSLIKTLIRYLVTSRPAISRRRVR